MQLSPFFKEKVNDFFYKVGWWLRKCSLRIINFFLKIMEVDLLMTPYFILFNFRLIIIFQIIASNHWVLEFNTWVCILLQN
jgi:hypothetical protein